MARGAGAVAGRALRGGRGSLIGLALVVALGGGAALGASVAAHRTDRAYAEYVEDAEVAELVINPSVRSAAMDEAIRGFEGVEDVRADTLLFASVSVTEPTTFAEGADDDPWLQTRGSVDGRYIDTDRPAVSDGRVPSGEREVFVSDDFREELERIEGRPLEVGDEIELGVFWPGIFDPALSPELAGEDLDLDAVIEPIGVERLRISGFGVLADEVLPDELYPRQRLIVSQDVTARYNCTPDITSEMSYQEAYVASFPPDCAAQYDSYSLNLRGDGAVRSVREQFQAAAEELSKDLPPGFAEAGIGYYYISQERADLDEAVREMTRPTVTVLLAFSIVASLATVTIAGLMVARQQRRTEEVKRHLRAFGATRGQVTRWSATPLLLAATAGLLGALVVGVAASPIGPVGTVRTVALSTGPSLPASVALPGIVGLAVVLTVVIVGVAARSAWRTARGATEPRAGSSRVGRVVQRGGPSLSTGIGAVVDGRRAGAGVAAMLGCVVATAIAAAAIVFGASLSALVDEPEAYGWPWDLAVITGGGYGDTLPAEVEKRLGEKDVRDDIAEYDFYSFDPSALLDGQATPVVFAYPNAFDTPVAVLEGRAPASAGEAVIGNRTAADLGIEIGDRLVLEAFEPGELDVQVVGLAALPELGSFVADRTGLGTGAFVLLDSDPAAASSAALTGIRLRDDARAAPVLAALEPDLASWSKVFEVPVSHDEPVRPAEIVNVSELRSAPLVLGGLLLASLALGLWLAVTLSVRDRRHELAVLRAIGFGGSDVRWSVRWQGLLLVGVGAVLGVPLGIVGGRLAWRTFADRLGVVPDTAVPAGWLGALVLVTIVLGWLAVAPPARTAARLSPADELLVP